MTIAYFLLFTTTAVCFVAWIWQAVSASTARNEVNRLNGRLCTLKQRFNHSAAVVCSRTVECDELHKTLGELRKRLNHLQDELTRVAEALKTIEQFQQLFWANRETKWSTHVFDCIADQELRMQLHQEPDQRTKQLIHRQIQDATKARAFLDEFISEHLPAETAETEVPPMVFADLADDRDDETEPDDEAEND